MVWVRTELGTPEDRPLWKTEAQRSWLTWLSFFYQRHQSAGPLPQSSPWDCVASSCTGSDGKSLPGSEANEGGSVLPISTYATSGELFCGLYSCFPQHNNLLCCFLKCVTSKTINGRYLFLENYLCYISLFLYFQQVVAKSSNALRFFFLLTSAQTCSK